MSRNIKIFNPNTNQWEVFGSCNGVDIECTSINGYTKLDDILLELKRLIDNGTSVVNVTGVTLNKSTTTILNGGKEQLIATVAPSNATNKNVTWSSSNNAIATVSSTGLVTSVGVGSAIITATSVDGSKTATCSCTITSGASNPDIIPETNKVIHYDFALVNQGAINGKWFDLSGNSNNGTLNGFTATEKLTNELQFAPAKSCYIDTGIKLCDTDKDYSIEFVLSQLTWASTNSIVACWNEIVGSYGGLYCSSNTSGKYEAKVGSDTLLVSFSTDSIMTEDNLNKVIKISKVGNVYKFFVDGIEKKSVTSTFRQHSNNLLIGACNNTTGVFRYGTFKMKSFKVYIY